MGCGKVLILAVVLYLVFLPMNCFALQNPVDYSKDQIRQATNSATDDAISKIKIETHEAWGKIKDAIKAILGFVLELVTILAIGWSFSFLVDKREAMMIKVVVGLCGFTEFIKVVAKLFEAAAGH